jgi:hypothetical protein
VNEENRPPATGERRKSRRYAPKGGMQVTCRKGAPGLGPNLGLSVLDVSEGGTRLVLGEPLEPGQVVEVILQPAGYAKGFKASGRVVWCVEAAAGGHVAGIAFDQRLEYVALLAVGRVGE